MILVRWLLDDYQMPRQTSANSHQTSVRQIHTKRKVVNELSKSSQYWQLLGCHSDGAFLTTLTTLTTFWMTTIKLFWWQRFWQLVDNLTFCVHHIYTRHIPYMTDVWWTSDVNMVQFMSGGHMVHVWCICGTCLTNVWWALNDVRWDIWQTSDNCMMSIRQGAPDK